ncbi:MAG: hypothetical protein H6559_02170 [Lewinellaceae bacterium]|nr:hypothetical protein [Lewinellaceae bacterium]
MEEIKDAFKPFYTTTVLSEETDINKLHDLQEALDDYRSTTKTRTCLNFSGNSTAMPTGANWIT